MNKYIPFTGPDTSSAISVGLDASFRAVGDGEGAGFWGVRPTPLALALDCSVAGEVAETSCDTLLDPFRLLGPVLESNLAGSLTGELTLDDGAAGEPSLDAIDVEPSIGVAPRYRLLAARIFANS